MKIGLHISDFTWEGGVPELPRRLGEIARRAEDGGVDRISVMDHVWQIGVIGPPEHEMLEAYTTLGWLAAQTERVKLLTVVTAVVYRDPGLLAKSVTTLDVLSGGRAMLGIGAAWNEEESRGLGLFFPPLAERFERLEEALRICRQMWSDDEGPFDGEHYHLGRTLNSPQAVSRPHPPTRATSSTPLSWGGSWKCCAATARPRAATTTRSRRPPRSGSTSARTAST
jgi:alkanesulfonate monooxygenase SsuD/methylene tetrahydromethanopterin reductase-like flavin-dependent oxidoreductase (luciferase family)